MTERLSVPKPLSDPYFNLVVHAVQLKRVVEMLQWVEHEHSREIRHEDGQTTTESSYDYTQVTSLRPIESLTTASVVVIVRL